MEPRIQAASSTAGLGNSSPFLVVHSALEVAYYPTFAGVASLYLPHLNLLTPLG